MRGALLLLMLWYGAALRAEAAGGNGMQPSDVGEAEGAPLDCLPAASHAPRVHGGASTSACAASPDEVIEWRDWDASVFEQARREHKLVLLNLEAVWCHWCHVMAERTYSRADIQRFITAHFIAVKVDQDARPDLATRYRDYGWPATIVLDADGNDIAKRAGYIAPEAMSALLAAVHSDPTPEPAARPFDPGVPSTSPLLTEALRAELRARHARAFDDARGGLRTMQKYLDRDSVEWSLVLAAGGDANEAAMARRTLDAARALLDPAWGGFYQYSTGGQWHRPHFEKLMKVQAAYLRSYSLAYSLWRRDDDLTTMREVVRYVDAFLTSPDGAFLVSQDADLVPGQHSADYFALDDAARRARGVPRVDTQRYARENGWMIEALGVAYEATGDHALLARALRAMDWVRAHRRAPDGGWRHDERDASAAYLADNLAMARASLQLHRVTGERTYLADAVAAAAHIRRSFVQGPAGVLPVHATPHAHGPLAPRFDTEDNIGVARFFNLLAHYTGDAGHRQVAEVALRLLATERVALRRMTEPGILLAEREYANLPTHLTLVAAKPVPGAAPTHATALHAAMLRVPGYYKRVEWWDVREGALPNPDVAYPQLARPAAFVCTHQVCSVPLFEPADLARFIERRLPVPAQPPLHDQPPATAQPEARAQPVVALPIAG